MSNAQNAQATNCMSASRNHRFRAICVKFQQTNRAAKNILRHRFGFLFLVIILQFFFCARYKKKNKNKLLFFLLAKEMQCENEECDCDDCCSSGGRGYQGLQGPAALGSPGPQGYPGPEYAAPPGAQGSQGPLCCDFELLRGAQGLRGPQGQFSDGPQGKIGWQGSFVPGLPGPQGIIGFQGFQGSVMNGMQGAQGTNQAGAQGPQGFQGNFGLNAVGPLGPQGPIQISTYLIGPNSFTLPPSFTSIILSVLPPSSGKYLATITFSTFDNLMTRTTGSNITFWVQQDSAGILGSLRLWVSLGDVDGNRTPIIFDVISDDLSGTVPFTLHYYANQNAQLAIYDLTMTFIQL